MTDYQPDIPVIKSYVYPLGYDGKAYYVSTIERTSSSALNPCRYNETLVWWWNDENGERIGGHIWSGDASQGSIHTHQDVVEKLMRLEPLT